MPRVEERPRPPVRRPGGGEGGGGAGGGQEAFPLPHLGLLVILAAVTSLFAALTSAYLVRMGLPGWQALPTPPLLWLNTLLLLLASLSLEKAARQESWSRAKPWALAGGVLGVGFLLGQLLAWRLLLDLGYAPAGNPASGFFYLITGLHGLHLLGGVLALAWPLARQGRALRPCAWYWHYLLGVWLFFLGLLLRS
ncbi:cytochrome c oxidase subunit 3 [Thermus thermamylovorans]|uniref:Cytochrome c oxidase subunit 3 n=1 Tax=Thermus thermamylovorans TaxID=2509362 RepID=A0A4Q9B5Z7_9DEIN|nr:cytochrome c oxidase subunit 3 [Thermus thermamylovorans]TBH20464.1 cytochrome c oxidase subunit 3 [Thermus thermamylovorans]